MTFHQITDDEFADSPTADPIVTASAIEMTALAPTVRPSKYFPSTYMTLEELGEQVTGQSELVAA